MICLLHHYWEYLPPVVQDAIRIQSPYSIFKDKRTEMKNQHILFIIASLIFGCSIQLTFSQCGPVTLPYFEDFESPGNIVTYTENTDTLDGFECPLWSYEQSDINGRLQYFIGIGGGS